MSMKWQFKSVRTRLAVWFLVVAVVPLFVGVTVLYLQQADVIGAMLWTDEKMMSYIRSLL